MKTKKIIYIALLFFFISGSVFALDLVDLDYYWSKLDYDDNEGSTVFNSLLIPAGGRGEGLGSAFTGLADDASYIDYNPAASSILNYTEAFLSHNTWIADSAMECFSITTRKENLGLGAAARIFYVPFSEYNIFGEKLSSNYYSESTVAVNASYNFNPSYSFKGCAVGCNVKASYRSIPDFFDDETGEKISTSGFNQSGFAIMADIGCLLRFNLLKFYSSREANLRIGVALTNLGIAFVNGGLDGTQILDNSLPTAISAGFSYTLLQPLTITLEFRQPINLFDIKNSNHFSFGMGVAYNFSEEFSLVCGFMLKGGNPRISAGTQFTVSGIDISACYTFDLTTTSNPVNHISIGMKMPLGDKGRGKLQRKIDTLYQQGLYNYVQSSTEKDRVKATEYLELAISLWEELLTLDPGFTPAQEGLDVIKLELENLRNVQNEQMLEKKASDN